MSADVTCYQVDTGVLKELFSTGKSMEPTIARLNDHKMALSRDEATIFVDAEGNPTQKSVLTWTEVPIAMGERRFYLARSLSLQHVCLIL